MATTVGSFSAIDDNEVDAESPITESLVTRIRDNSYWIDPASTRTAATSNTLVLTPNQSAGTTQWQEVSTIASVDGTKGTISGTLTTSWVTLTTVTSGILMIDLKQSQTSDGGANATIKIDLSDDTWVSSYLRITSIGNVWDGDALSGTITTGQTVAQLWDVGAGPEPLQFRRDSGNLQYRAPGANIEEVHADWVIL